MDSTLGKILIFVGIVLSLGALGFVIYTQHQLSVQQTAIQTEQIAQRQLIDGVVRSSNYLGHQTRCHGSDRVQWRQCCGFGCYSS